MRLLRRRSPLVSVVVPAYGVEAWLPECLEGLTAQSHREWEAIVVDDGSPDRSGEIAEEWAARDARIKVVHTANGGLGAARNEGVRHAEGDYLAFLDSDDVLPQRAYSTLVASLEDSGSDFVTGSMIRIENGRDVEPPWMRRLHRPPLSGARIGERPEILGDVFAWNKLFRTDFWTGAGLAWPEGIRYEDQPATTRAYLTGRFDVVPDVVYHWRIRDDGTSITQQRAALDDLRDRWATKRQALDSVRAHGDPDVTRVFVDRVLAGDLWRYFVLLPQASDEWYDALRDGILDLWEGRSLVHSGLTPVHRLCGWLVEQGRRDEATALMSHLAAHRGPLPRRADPGTGTVLITVPEGLVDTETVDPRALTVRAHEA